MLLHVGLLSLFIVVTAKENLLRETMVILEFPKLQNVEEDSSTIALSVDLSFEWNLHNKTSPGFATTHGENDDDDVAIRIDKLVEMRASGFFRRASSTSSIASARSFRWLRIRCEHFDLSSFPYDDQTCKLSFTSARNASEVALVPHLIASPGHQMGTSSWHMQLHKAFVQWVVIEGHSFEQAIFEFKLRRTSASMAEIPALCMFFINFLAISARFSVFRVVPVDYSGSGKLDVVAQVGVCLFLVANSPNSPKVTTIVHQALSFVLLAVFTNALAQILPFFAFHLRCCPLEAHPNPPDVPSPHDRLSLDTEKVKYSAALDSARADSLKSPRTVAFDMCIAELKFTLANLSETLNVKAVAKWRKKIWRKGFKRVEIVAFIVMQLANFGLLVAHWK